MPKILDRCVTRLMDDPTFSPQDGHTKQQSAYAVCTEMLQESGILKKGTTELTEKGRGREVEIMATESAILANHANLTFHDIEEALRDALTEALVQVNPVGELIGDQPWVVDVLYLDQAVIYRYDGKHWRAPFTINDDYTATVGKGTPVIQVWIEASSDAVWRTEDGTESPSLMPIRAAVWSTAMMNDLPDTAFVYIETGGTKADGKTSPRSLRHFPYKGSDGSVDLPHLKNALSRIPQSSLPVATKGLVLRKAQRIARANGIDTTKAGAALQDGAMVLTGQVPAQFLRLPMVSRAGRGSLTMQAIHTERGIYGLFDGETCVERLFDQTAPHRWTLADAKKWMAKPFICAAMTSMSVVAMTDEMPTPVKDAMEKLKTQGLSPFMVRIAGKIGRFHAESGKVAFTQAFYEKFGPKFVGKPYFLGHKGVDSADYREKIGQIVHFGMDPSPEWWVNISEGAGQIRKQILEEQVLGVTDEATGASSIEGYASRTEEQDGYHEPIEFQPQGIALVRREAATGTRIDKVYH